MKYILIILYISLLTLVGCVTPKSKPTEVIKIEPINQQGSVIIEQHGNITRIYSINQLKKLKEEE